MRTIVVILSLFLVVAGLGCAALSTYITPAEIDRPAVAYVVENGMGQTDEYDGYPSVFKAERLKKAVDNTHVTVQFKLRQLMQSDDLAYGIHKNVVANNVEVGMQREEMLFGEKGLLSLGLSMAGFGTLTGFLGLMRKRPGDITSAEYEQALSQARGETVEELSAKQKQLVQVVQGVQRFINTWKDTGVTDELKTCLNFTQDTNTQIAVASVKKELNL
jgi:hypothetical protein